MRAKPGDSLLIKGHRVGDADRRAEILEVRGKGRESRYLVRWADGHEAWIFPGSDAIVEHKKTKPKSG